VTSLGFTSLKNVTHGNVYIGYLRNLCYDRLVNWTSVIKAPVHYRTFQKNGVLLRRNKPDDECKQEVIPLLQQKLDYCFTTL